MSKLKERFDEEIKERKFTVLEMEGFRKQPKLAIKAGIAIGYSMAMRDATGQIKTTEEFLDHYFPETWGKIGKG